MADTPVVCLLGPRQSGKTTLAQQLAPDRAFLSLDEHNYYQTAGADPDGFVASLPEAVTLDEAQVRDAQELARLLELLALRSAELLNTRNLANSLGLHRATVDHYIAVLERLFLVRRLLAWHRNPAKRLVKTPKIHLLDSGLAATLADLTATDWLHYRDRMGHLLESFVVQQLMAQATWTEPDLRFWHYRDKDQVEVDVVLTRGHKTWGIEVKAASATGRPLRRGFRVWGAALHRPRPPPIGRRAHTRRAAERIVGAVGRV